MIGLWFRLLLAAPSSAPASLPATLPSEPPTLVTASLFGQGHKLLRLWTDRLEGSQADATGLVLFSTPIDPQRRYHLAGGGAALAIGDDDLRVVEAASGKIRGVLAGHFANAFFSSDGRLAAVTTKAATDSHWRLMVLSLKDGKLLGEFDLDGKEPRGFAVSTDHSHLVVFGEDGLASWWPMSKGKPLELKSHRGPVLAAVVSANGMRVLTGGADKKARLWDSKTGRLINTISESGSVRSVAFSPDGKSIYAAGEGGVHVWDVSGPLKKKLSPAKDQLIIGLYEGGKTLVTSSPTQTLFYETKSGKLLRQLNGQLVNQSGLSVEGNVVTTFSNGQALLWNYSTGGALAPDKSSQ